MRLTLVAIWITLASSLLLGDPFSPRETMSGALELATLPKFYHNIGTVDPGDFFVSNFSATFKVGTLCHE